MPPVWGARYQAELVYSQGRTASHSGGEGGKGGGGVKEERAERRRWSGAVERTGGGAREREL